MKKDVVEIDAFRWFIWTFMMLMLLLGVVL
jgi:hypothetical protein